MKLGMTHEYDHPLDLVLKVTHYDIIENPSIYEDMPNVTSIKRSHFTQHPDGRQDIEYTYCAHGQIPKIAQKILTPDMLSWREVSRWDPSSLVYHYEIIPFHLRNVFHCKGKWTYAAKNGRVFQTLDGTVNVKLPLIGPIIEQRIAEELYKNQKDMYKVNLKKLAGMAKS